MAYNSTDLHYEGDPSIVTVPASGSDPVEITFTRRISKIVITRVEDDIHFTWGAAGTAASGEGNTKIASNDSRGRLDAGSAGEFEVDRKGGTDSLYLRAVAGSSTTVSIYRTSTGTVT